MSIGFILVNIGVLIGMLSTVFYSEMTNDEEANNIASKTFYMLFIMVMLFDFVVIGFIDF